MRYNKLIVLWETPLHGNSLRIFAEACVRLIRPRKEEHARGDCHFPGVESYHGMNTYTPLTSCHPWEPARASIFEAIGGIAGMQIWQTHLNRACQSCYAELFDVVTTPIWTANIWTDHLRCYLSNVMLLIYIVLLPFFHFGHSAVSRSLSRLMARDDTGNSWQGLPILLQFPRFEEH